MIEPCPILIASDLSACSDIAVARGMQLAERRNCAVTALHVIQEEPLWWVGKSRDRAPTTLREDVLREVSAGLDRQVRAAARLLESEPGPVDLQVRQGRPVDVVSELALKNHAELIVVGAHGRHVVRDWLIGTTAEKIVRADNVPVLVAQIEPTRSYRVVVVATDFSEPSRAAFASALAWAPQAQFILMHAYETWFESYIEAATYERIRREQEEDFHDQLRAFAREAGVRGDHVVDYRVIAGHPGTAIVDAALEARADLTVCGTQGDTGLRQLLLGSVAQHILRESKSDVLAVRNTVSFTDTEETDEA
ncbi:MAG: universal stress protein [Halothiobacillaceae bacterium]